MAIDGQEWASLIREQADEENVEAVILAINQFTADNHVKSSAVVIACAQILAQCIALAPSGVEAEMRAAVHTLIDGFAMQVAIAVDG